MDSPAEWTASALFSPSKARVQQAQTKDWAFVDAWLAKKYEKRLPTFERNEETLQALLSLTTLNEATDEQQTLVERVERAAGHAISKRNHQSDDAYAAVLASLSSSGHDGLHALAESAVLLQSKDKAETATSVWNLTTRSFESSEQVRRVREQQAAIRQEQERLVGLLHEMREESFNASPELPDQTAELTRNTKHLRAKVAEYDERLSALRSSGASSPSIEDISGQLREVDGLQHRLEFLNAELSAFSSLPSEPKAARDKVESARSDLRSLTTRLDQLFEDLVDQKG